MTITKEIVTLWNCGRHKHTSFELAQKCQHVTAGKHARVAQKKKEADERVRVRTEKRRKAFELRQEGRTYKEIAALVGCSPDYAVSLVRRGQFAWNREPWSSSHG